MYFNKSRKQLHKVTGLWVTDYIFSKVLYVLVIEAKFGPKVMGKY